MVSLCVLLGAWNAVRSRVVSVQSGCVFALVIVVRVQSLCFQVVVGVQSIWFVVLDCFRLLSQLALVIGLIFIFFTTNQI